MMVRTEHLAETYVTDSMKAHTFYDGDRIIHQNGTIRCIVGVCLEVGQPIGRLHVPLLVGFLRVLHCDGFIQ